ncbi:hypothetical protein L1887_01636 [Cichorium endivia]|nr:hypothetical protein L1887_01636 [Cichorium endivia]
MNKSNGVNLIYISRINCVLSNLNRWINKSSNRPSHPLPAYKIPTTHRSRLHIIGFFFESQKRGREFETKILQNNSHIKSN